MSDFNREELEGLYHLSRELLTLDDYDRMLDTIFEQALKILRAEHGFLVLARGLDFDFKVVRNWKQDVFAGNGEPVSRSIVRGVLERGEPVLIEDALADERFAKTESILRLGIRSVLAAPLEVQGERKAALYLEARSLDRLFGPEKFPLFTAILELSQRALTGCVKRLLLEQRNSLLEKDFLARHRFPGIITRNPGFVKILETVAQVAPSELPILVQGPTGTGKELIVRALHLNSRRAQKPFVPVNCGAIAPALIESELFGHVRGAFTGAHRDKTGLIAAAEGGTLFLDEVGELPPEVQVKLLRTLQFGEVLPVGATQSKAVDVRIVAATNRDLESEVRAGKFREDLLYRLNVVTIDLPPLCQRSDDILPLFYHFLTRAAAEAQRPLPEVSPQLEKVLQTHSWPGNVRDLENEARRLLVVTPNGLPLTVDRLSPRITRSSEEPAGSPTTLDELERQHIRKTLEAMGGNRTLAARALGISREGLRKKLSRLGGSWLAVGLITLFLDACGPGGAPQGAGQGSDPATAARHVVLVSLDTVRADHLGAYGHALAQTPNLDRVAREGVRFADVSTPVPLTLPAHASLLSGLSPLAHGLTVNGGGRFPAELTTLATHLAAAGFTTGAFVGAFVLDQRFGLARGFAHYDDAIERPAGQRPQLEAERPAAEVIGRAVAWLQHQDGQRPVFLWVHLYDAHAPYAPPEPFRSGFADRPYDGEIAYLDTQVGELLHAIEQPGWAEKTLLAVVADHGEGLGDHGEASHGLLLYESTLRVPWLLHGPGLPAGHVVHSPVSLLDVAPTLAAWVKQPLVFAGHELVGRDLGSALRAREEPAPSELYATTSYPTQFGWSAIAALRHGSLKFIAAPQPELYDLAPDPGETRNQFATARRTAQPLAERLQQLVAQMVPASQHAVDATTRAKLSALGYAAGATQSLPRIPDPERADPKVQVALFSAWEKAYGQLEAGELSAALPVLTQLAVADPKNPIFRNSLARAFKERGELSSAIAEYQAAVQGAPADVDNWYDLASVLNLAGRPQEAFAAAREALSRDPARSDVANLLGISYLAEGQLGPAREHFELALSLDPRDATAANNLGNVLRAQGQLSAAEEAYRRALALAADYPDPWNGLGTLAIERQQFQQAIQAFDRALELAPGFHEARLNRGIAYELLGDRQTAAAVYRDVLTKTAGNPHARQQREAADELLRRLALHSK